MCEGKKGININSKAREMLADRRTQQNKPDQTIKKEKKKRIKRKGNKAKQTTGVLKNVMQQV